MIYYLKVCFGVLRGIGVNIMHLILIFQVIDFDPEKIERKSGARYLAFSIYKIKTYLSFNVLIHHCIYPIDLLCLK